MAVTVTINESSPQAYAIVELLKTFDFVKFKESTPSFAISKTITTKEKKLQKNLTQGLKELKAFREGKMQFQELDEFLDEI